MLVRGKGSFNELLRRGLLEDWLLELPSFEVSGEPTLSLLSRGLNLAKELKPELIVAIGGGSVLDTGKAIAKLFFFEGNIRDAFYRRAQLPERTLPLIAAPTTSGTGSEVTAVSVFIDEEGDYKGSIGYRKWFPEVAVVDPKLTVTAPERVTLSAGLDALTHALESIASNQADEFTTRLAWQAADVIFESLPEVLRYPDELRLRERLSFASLLAGMAFANTGVGLAHAIGHALGVVYHLPHGITCAMAMPFVWELNAPYIEERVRISLNLSTEDIRRRIWLLYETLGFKVSEPLGKKLAISKGELERVKRITLMGRSLRTNPSPVDESTVERLMSSILG